MAVTPNAYLAAMRAARARGLALDTRQARAIEAALREWANELSKMLGNLPADKEMAVRRSVAVIRDAARNLERRIVTSTADSIEVTVEETLAVWHEASLKVAESVGIPNSMMGAIARPEVTQAAAFGSADSARTWRTLVRTRVNEAERDVTRIITQALTKNVDPDTLANAIRPYVQGSDKAPEPLRPMIEDQPATTRGAGYTMDYNAKRIAFSETHNARREAEVQHFQADPLVEVGRWTLSPNRGTQRLPCACDALAHLDWYGLGLGVFPLNMVPLSPHPFDRCEFMPIVRKTKDAHRAKPGSIALQLDPYDVKLPREGEMTPAAEARIRMTLASILRTKPSDTNE